MRGGRNKFGTYYKLDRAQRVKQQSHSFDSTTTAGGVAGNSTNSNASSSSSTKTRRQSTAGTTAASSSSSNTIILTDPSVSSSTPDPLLQQERNHQQQQLMATNVANFSGGGSHFNPSAAAAAAAAGKGPAVTMLQHQHQCIQSATSTGGGGFDAYLQSPTLSSSSTINSASTSSAASVMHDFNTHFTDLMAMQRHSAAQAAAVYMSNAAAANNGDSLAMLLGQSAATMDVMDPHHSSAHHHHSQHPQHPQHSQQQQRPSPASTTYAPMMPAYMTTSLHVTTPLPMINVVGQATAHGHQLLPICPIPTEKSIDNVFYGSAGQGPHHQHYGAPTATTGLFPTSKYFLEELADSTAERSPALATLRKLPPTAASALDFCIQAANEHVDGQMMPWARADAHFSRLSENCRFIQFKSSWATIHLIDFTYASLMNELQYSVKLNGREAPPEFPMALVCLLGCGELEGEWAQLCRLMQQLMFDRQDYVAFKYLTLFDTSIYGGEGEHQCTPEMFRYREEVEGIHTAVLHSWAEYRRCSPSSMPLLDVLHRFSALASKAVELLKKKVQCGEAKPSKLLAEMLSGHSPTIPPMAPNANYSTMKSASTSSTTTINHHLPFYSAPPAVRH